MLRALDPGKPKILHLATGGGKTRVANDIIVRWTAERGGPVLWITKDWRLLKQAAGDLCRRNHHQRISRLGGDGQALHPLPEGHAQHVIYTTIQTMIRRLSTGALSSMRPTLVVWDECHWGEHGRAGKLLTACKRAGIPILGLTATPRDVSRYEVAYSKTFRELVDDGFLARPVVQTPVRTGVRWNPELRSRFDDVTRASLNELAENRRRNECIVEHYVQNAGRYGKTIVFACNINHVERLSDLFCRRGIAARPVHSEFVDGWNHGALEDFKRGAVQVLVNMEMLTHGIDVPDARSVFLCRPTTSDILFAQMVGRAARRDEGKTSFYVVEFTDNVTEHGELFETSQRYFAGSGIGEGPPPSVVNRSRTPRQCEHAFDPIGAPTWIPDDPALPESVRGLWYRQGQTFGIEFELTPLNGDVPQLGREWKAIAERIRTSLQAALPGLVAPMVIEGYAGSEGEKDCSVWNVEYDNSAGWEVTSRVLANREGFIEADVACTALDTVAADLGLRVNHRTGTHVHIGWLGRDLAEVKRAIALARLFEPGLATLVAPSRVVSFDAGTYDLRCPNPYCRPVSAVFGEQAVAQLRTIDDVRRIANGEAARYVTFNLRPLAHLHTVEVRMHNGTLEARKILLWVSLWQQLLWAAAYQSTVPSVPDRSVIQPDADIVKLAMEYLPDARQPQQRLLLRRLDARRAEILQYQWSRVPELAPWVAAAANWQSAP